MCLIINSNKNWIAKNQNKFNFEFALSLFCLQLFAQLQSQCKFSIAPSMTSSKRKESETKHNSNSNWFWSSDLWSCASKLMVDLLEKAADQPLSPLKKKSEKKLEYNWSFIISNATWNSSTIKLNESIALQRQGKLNLMLRLHSELK